MTARAYANEKKERHSWAPTYLAILDAAGKPTPEEHAKLWRQARETFSPGMTVADVEEERGDGDLC